MSVEIVRVFEVMGNRYEVTTAFDEYNKVRSEQARKLYSIYTGGTNAVEQFIADFNRMYQPVLDAFRMLVDNNVNTPLEVATVGFAKLQYCKNEVLPRIGKRLIFKYTKDELISVEKVARHIELDSASYFSDFMDELQQIEDGKQRYLVSQEFKHLTRGDPMVDGIGFGVGGIAGVAAGMLASSVGLGILRRIGDAAGQGINSSGVAKETSKTVANARKSLYNAFIDMANQVQVYCFNAMKKEMDEDVDALGRKPFQELSEERALEIKAKSENYGKAYKSGDITPERYASYLFTAIKDTPHDPTLYQNLYKIASDINDTSAKKAILNFTDYLGLNGQMKGWMIEKGYTPAAPKPTASAEAKTPSVGAKPISAAQAVQQQYAGIIHCVGTRTTAQEDPRIPLRTVGLRPDGTVVATGDKSSVCYTETLGWRNIIAVCSKSPFIVGLKTDGTVLIAGLRRDHPFYETITGWRDITAVSCGRHHALGLKRDGTVVSAPFSDYTKDNQCDVVNWRDIVAISAGYYHSVGVKADGTVVAVGRNEAGQCNVSGWRNIVAVSARSFTMGLKKDGSVIYSYADRPEGILSDNTSANVIAISAASGAEGHALELRSDGTVAALGGNSFGQLNVSGWSNIIAIAAGDGYSVGVKADGTVVTVGKNEYGECDVQDWKIGLYSSELAAKRLTSDKQSAAWKAAGLCPVCGGQLSWFTKTCKACGAKPLT